MERPSPSPRAHHAASRHGMTGPSDCPASPRKLPSSWSFGPNHRESATYIVARFPAHERIINAKVNTRALILPVSGASGRERRSVAAPSGVPSRSRQGVSSPAPLVHRYKLFIYSFFSSKISWWLRRGLLRFNAFCIDLTRPDTRYNMASFAERGAIMQTNNVDKRIKEGAKAIASDLAGPAGPIALARVVARHLAWFDLCDQRGMSWPQICALLQAAGAGRANGAPFSHGHVSATVWRQRQKVKAKPQSSVTASATTGSAVSALEQEPMSCGTDARSSAAVSAGAPAAQPGERTGRPAPAEPVRSKKAGEASRQGTDMKAHLKRAADARRNRTVDD